MTNINSISLSIILLSGSIIIESGLEGRLLFDLTDNEPFLHKKGFFYYGKDYE